MKNEIRVKHKSNGPTTILVHGSNDLAFGIAKTLLEQGGRVIIVDTFNSKSKSYITKLKEYGTADFVDFKGYASLLDKVGSLDYLIYFLHDYLSFSDKFQSKDFLEESGTLNQSLKAVREYNSKFSLISTVKLNQELSSHILDNRASVPSPYSPIELQKYCETLVAEYRDKSKINARIIRIGTVIGNNVNKIDDDVLLDLIDSSLNKTYLNIRGEGLDVHYLINIDDAIYGVLRLTFSDKTEGEVITLANDHDYTTLSLAYKILEINSDVLEIKFLPSERQFSTYSEQYIPAINASKFGWTQKKTIEQSILETIQTIDPVKAKKVLNRPRESDVELIKSKNVKTPLGEVTEAITSPIQKGKKSISEFIDTVKHLSPARLISLFGITTILVLLLIFIISPIISISISSTSLYFNSKKSYESLSDMNFSSASKYLNKAYNNAKRAQLSIERFEWLFSAFKQKDMYDNISQLMFASEYGLLGAKDLTFALNPLSEYIKNFEPALDFSSTNTTTTRDYREYLLELQNNSATITRSAYNLELASTLIDNIEVSTFPKVFQNPLIELKANNEKIMSSVSSIDDILLFIPDILGLEERKTYLILLQNQNEIRATGGWLTSYIILGIERGQIRELKVDDIYNIEGQLRVAKKTFTAPKDMQVALSTNTWSLSTSNWDPDLSKTLEVAQFMLGSTDAGLSIDGIVTIDTEFIKSLLSIWGGIDIPGEAEKITKDNLDTKIYQIHSAFKPGETQKTTFLANLSNSVINKILSENISGYANISSSIIDSLDQKHLQIYLKNNQANDFFQSNYWGGRITNENINTPIPIEWNWGANKANAYLEKTYTTEINIKDESSIEYTFDAYFQNKSTSSVYPQGEYKNYYRIYLPNYAEVISTSGFENNKYSVITKDGYKIVSGWFNVPISRTKQFQVKYSVNKEKALNEYPISQSLNTYTLPLSIYKQPGTYNDQYTLKINYPISWSVISSEGLDRLVNTLSTTKIQDKTLEFNIIWEKKD